MERRNFFKTTLMGTGAVIGGMSGLKASPKHFVQTASSNLKITKISKSMN